MNASTVSKPCMLQLVDIVELKWMLAGEGLHIHVEKLQSDPGYAHECLLAAERSATNRWSGSASALLPVTGRRSKKRLET